jgi:hypothetical protein
MGHNICGALTVCGAPVETEAVDEREEHPTNDALQCSECYEMHCAKHALAFVDGKCPTCAACKSPLSPVEASALAVILTAYEDAEQRSSTVSKLVSSILMRLCPHDSDDIAHYPGKRDQCSICGIEIGEVHAA